MLETQAIVRGAKDVDVTSVEGLHAQLLALFREDLSKVGYTGTPVPFEQVTINGRSWTKYRLRVVGVLEYSTALTNDRYLAVQINFIDNTGEKSPAWLAEAGEQARELVSSMRLDSSKVESR